MKKDDSSVFWSSFKKRYCTAGCLVLLMAVITWRNIVVSTQLQWGQVQYLDSSNKPHHALTALGLEDSSRLILLDDELRTAPKKMTEHAEEDIGTSSSPPPCHFQKGQGTFIEEEDWKWIPQNCHEQYHDFVQWIRNEQRTTMATAIPTAATLSITSTAASSSILQQRTQPLSIIHIGDSLTFYQTKRLCDSWEYEMLPQLYKLTNNAQNKKVNQTRTFRNLAKNKGLIRKQNIIICTNTHQQTYSIARNEESDPPFWAVVSFRLFGMNKPCMPHIAGQHDSRLRATESERLREIFQGEVLDRLPTTDAETIVIIHSTLWDLSKGCNDLREVDSNFTVDFIQGMQDMEAVVRELLPRAKIYWRSGAPVTNGLSQRKWRDNRGRNRYAQQTLHSIIEKHAGPNRYLNWWQQVKGIADKNETTYTKLSDKDGIHPNQHLTDAFFNLIMNTVVDQHPTLWSKPSQTSSQ